VRTSGALGIAGAIGFYLAFIAFYVVCVGVTWAVYPRPKSGMAGV
jgi:hypothetical protein